MDNGRQGRGDNSHLHGRQQRRYHEGGKDGPEAPGLAFGEVHLGGAGVVASTRGIMVMVMVLVVDWLVARILASDAVPMPSVGGHLGQWSAGSWSSAAVLGCEDVWSST